jgi:hypothetical protein
MMRRSLPLAAAILLLALSGVAQGLWTGRWGLLPDLTQAASRCGDVVMTLGDWEGEPAKMNERELAAAEVVGYASRHYINRRTGQSVTVLLICGRPGPLSVHTPDICYAGAGYGVVGSPENYRLSPGGQDAELRTARFQKPGVAPDPLRIFWAWSARGPWQAPENPRLTFARSAVLYKLYVIRRMGNTDEPLGNDPCIDFLGVLLPELQRCLSTAP